MHRIRVYSDTSVFGGTQDEEFAEVSREFFSLVTEGTYRLLVSAAVYAELDRAPVGVQEVLSGIPADALEEVPFDEEVQALADEYVSAGALEPSALADALHVAAATVGRAEVIVSWNFRHIVNYERIRKFNAVNLIQGYATVDIRSPREMIHADKEGQGL